MSRVFWMAVGAVGGVATYRKSVQMAARAKELGPLGSAAAVAKGTSKLAGRTADGLGRLAEARDRRAGKLVSGSLVAATQEAPVGVPASTTGNGSVSGATQGAPSGGIPADHNAGGHEQKGDRR